MKKIIIFIVLLLNNTLIFGQDIDLTALPKAERDSLLITIAEQTALKYGDPQYLNTGKAPLISHHKNSQIGNRGTAEIYMVTYLYDPYQYCMNAPYTITVSIFAKTGKAYDIGFGTGYGTFNLDIKEYDGYFSYKEYEPDQNWTQRVLQKQQHFINQAGVTIEAGSVGGGTIKPPTTRPNK